MKLAKRLIPIVTHSITTALLSAAYVFGIGATAIVARALGKVFLVNTHNTSSWRPVTGSNTPERMF